jgi:hypothetical protein
VIRINRDKTFDNKARGEQTAFILNESLSLLPVINSRYSESSSNKQIASGMDRFSFEIVIYDIILVITQQ